MHLQHIRIPVMGGPRVEPLANPRATHNGVVRANAG
jgi:hypothetical protein